MTDPSDGWYDEQNDTKRGKYYRRNGAAFFHDGLSAVM
jgi:hypothetical protein